MKWTHVTSKEKCNILVYLYQKFRYQIQTKYNHINKQKMHTVYHTLTNGIVTLNKELNHIEICLKTIITKRKKL